MHGSMGNDKSKCHKVLRPFCTGDKCSKSGWTEDKNIEEAMELLKMEGKGKGWAKNLFSKDLAYFKGNPKVEGWLRLCSGSFKIEYDLHPMGVKAAKNEQHVANAQLVIEQKHAMLLGRKVKLNVMSFYSRYFQ